MESMTDFRCPNIARSGGSTRPYIPWWNSAAIIHSNQMPSSPTANLAFFQTSKSTKQQREVACYTRTKIFKLNNNQAQNEVRARCRA
ncbi:hypothetical protein JAAARDRAFT_569298 [Jaapia argillacea MUCL 33604]|uniref:Uncharacterized protein n=1 Tax=Jaapia argillacea MUCL 33604 TaxID=933084 RepID=A0A067QBX4_9AGAM|nr:hypothetical protein JAAARDRAFT_569298 [Jaapia argillacea MUCL 33604]